MAPILMAQFGLPTLKIRLNTQARPSEVVCELEVTRDDARVIEGSWTCTTEQIGLPARLEHAKASYRGYTFGLPDYVIDSVRDWVQQHDADGPLWLHLVKPIGYLAFVPWEEILQPRLGVPILRVPDFLSEPPTESPHKLEVALCGSMPAAKATFDLPHYLCAITENILNIPTHRTRRVHIFTDSQMVNAVRSRLEARGLLDDRVQVHDPETASAYTAPTAGGNIAESAGRIDNPWLRWMLDALKGRSIDVVHFISHGYLSHDKGALAFAPSPLENTDTRVARFAGAGQLTLFLTRLGAWSVLFTSPERNFSEMGLRLLADTVAQRRPGPLVHHELRLDPPGDDAAAAYDFLFGDENAPPPATPALFIYCHPARLSHPDALEIGQEYAAKSFSVIGAAPELQTDEEEQAPAWVSATERYIEQRVRDMEQMKTGESSARQSNVEEVERVLEQIRDIVAKTAGTTTSGAEE